MKTNLCSQHGCKLRPDAFTAIFRPAAIKSLFNLVFISKNSVESKNVRDEINYALHHNKKLLAVHMMHTSLPPGLELRLGPIQAIMKHKMKSKEYFTKLHESLNKLL